MQCNQKLKLKTVQAAKLKMLRAQQQTNKQQQHQQHRRQQPRAIALISCIKAANGCRMVWMYGQNDDLTSIFWLSTQKHVRSIRRDFKAQLSTEMWLGMETGPKMYRAYYSQSNFIYIYTQLYYYSKISLEIPYYYLVQAESVRKLRLPPKQPPRIPKQLNCWNYKFLRKTRRQITFNFFTNHCIYLNTFGTC